jgi:hypothetical protein
MYSFNQKQLRLADESTLTEIVSIEEKLHEIKDALAQHRHETIVGSPDIKALTEKILLVEIAIPNIHASRSEKIKAPEMEILRAEHKAMMKKWKTVLPKLAELSTKTLSTPKIAPVLGLSEGETAELKKDLLGGGIDPDSGEVLGEKKQAVYIINAWAKKLTEAGSEYIAERGCNLGLLIEGCSDKTPKITPPVWTEIGKQLGELQKIRTGMTTGESPEEKIQVQRLKKVLADVPMLGTLASMHGAFKPADKSFKEFEKLAPKAFSGEFSTSSYASSGRRRASQLLQKVQRPKGESASPSGLPRRDSGA